MEKQPKKWYSRWWFAVLMFLLGYAISMLINSCWLVRESGINL